MKMKKANKTYVAMAKLAGPIIGLLLGLFPIATEAQIRSGAAFLKMLPGSRQQSLGYSLTGSLDEMHSFYANPAATGFMREWQWSGSYTKWFADVYNMSLNAGWGLRNPLSQKTRVAIGINYLGVREFDSTLRFREAVSAYDVLVTASLGTPATFISKNISFGANVKYLYSQLSAFDAATVIYDFGALWRSNRFRFWDNFLDYSLISFGAAVTQLGSSLKFKTIETPLPLTYRFGTGIYFGSHHGLQLQLSADYQKVKDENGRFGLGTEISWGYYFSLRGGYNFDDNLLSKLSMGLSIRLDGQTGLLQHVVQENNAIRLDVAGLEGNDLFAAAYHGTVTSYPLCPEAFALIYPCQNDTLQSRKLQFAWQNSVDPDLYDDVSYLLCLEKNENKNIADTRLFEILQQAESGQIDLFQTLRDQRSKFYFVKDSIYSQPSADKISYHFSQLKPGTYYWTVLAYDRDEHYRLNENKIEQFYVLYPDLEIETIQFEPSPWITETDTQGVINFTIANQGDMKAKNILVTVTAFKLDQQISSAVPDTVYQNILPLLAENDSLRLSTTWLTSDHGAYNFEVAAHFVRNHSKFGQEINLKNNVKQALFYTIPKGRLATRDTVLAFITPKTDHNIPLISRVFFDHDDCQIKSFYFEEDLWLYPMLKILADRLQKNPDIYLNLDGFADSASGETLNLAKLRVEKVREKFLELGVSDRQIPRDGLKYELSPLKRATQNLDVLEERRYVQLRAFSFKNNEEDISIFNSVHFKSEDDAPVPLPVTFLSSVHGFVPEKEGILFLHSLSASDSIMVTYAKHSCDSVLWQHAGLLYRDWLNQQCGYYVSLLDTLGRHFRTRARFAQLTNIDTHLPLIVGLAEFNNLHPYPITTWDELILQLKERLLYDKQVHIRFIGHACGIPPNTINNKFSNIRAQRFQRQFLAQLKKYQQTDPELYSLITSRLDQNDTVGKGSYEPFNCQLVEQDFLKTQSASQLNSYLQIKQQLETSSEHSGSIEPFRLKLEQDKIRLVGDNDIPEGRQINRRIEIQLYFPQGE